MCCKCDLYSLVLGLEEYIVSEKPTDYIFLNDLINKYFYIAQNDIECDECLGKIVAGESYIEDDYICEDIFQYIAKQVMEKIHCCEECCKGSDISIIKHSIFRCFDEDNENPEEIIENLIYTTSIKDLLDDILINRYDVWGNYYDSIIEYIKCPKCKNGSGENYEDKTDYGKFNLYTDVYTQNDINHFNNIFYGDDYEEAKKHISELAQNFTFDELVAVKNELIAVKNENFSSKISTRCKYIIEELIEFIRRLFHEEKWYMLSDKRIIFRARVAPISDTLGTKDLWEPPQGKASHGRYNYSGTSILYCSNNKEVVKKEVDLPNGHRYNIAKLAIKKPMKLFPINYVFGGKYDGLINESVPDDCQSNSFKTQYILSNIISHICNNIGYDGIVYRSTKDSNSINYALFCKYTKQKDIDILSVETE